jgi:hypothetical protein
MERQLSDISVEMAKKLMGEVEFKDRIIGTKMSGAGGNNRVSIYSLQEVAEFLHADSIDVLMQMGKSTISQINIPELIRWIADVYEDQELADAITEGISTADNYIGEINIIRSLIKERINQCEEVLK